MPKRPLDSENKENEQPIPAKIAKNIDTEEPEPLINEQEEEEEDKGPWPIAGFIENNDGQLHPTNKQYYVYQNTKPSMISNTARFWSRKYLKILRHVNPDVYNV
jgi:hypothetical protein